jgi:hypothetical protein
MTDVCMEAWSKIQKVFLVFTSFSELFVNAFRKDHLEQAKLGMFLVLGGG